MSDLINFTLHSGVFIIIVITEDIINVNGKLTLMRERLCEKRRCLNF